VIADRRYPIMDGCSMVSRTSAVSRKSAAPLRSARFLVLAALAVGLASCQEEHGFVSAGAKAQRPLRPEMMDLLAKKDMRKEDPILIRIFKQDATLEVWKRDKTGKYAFLKDYKICAWGGTVGPKIKEGDKQSPEGFYTVTPWRMNPNSQYHLSFDVGFPNAFDRAYGRTGAAIMVHGACSSAGCFAMTDGQVEEIYALAREAFAGGQPSFQVQSFPFRMTAQNMARNRNNPHIAFWKNLKEGHDHFEVTKLEPKVDVCEKRYVFNAQPKDSTSTTFNAANACPTYEVPAHIAMAVAAKSKADDGEMSTMVAAFDEKEKAAAEALLAKKLEQSKPKPEGSMMASLFAASRASDEATASVPAPAMTPIAVPIPRAAPGRPAAAPAAAVASAKEETGVVDRLFSFGSKSEPDSPAKAAVADAPLPVPPVPAVPAAAPSAKPGAIAAPAAPAAVAASAAPAPAKAESRSFWQKINPF
jgi:murein L,D-transpeptidase YafK